MSFLVRNIPIFLISLLCFGVLFTANAQANSENKKPFCDSRYIANAVTGNMCEWGDGNALYIFKPENVSRNVPILYISGGPGIIPNHYFKQLQHLADQLSRIVLLPASYGLYGDTIDDFDCVAGEQESMQYRVSSDKQELIARERVNRLSFLSECLQELAGKKEELVKYNTLNFAKNLMDLRQKVGIQSWAVMAESYGARPALALAQVDTKSINALILDSPETPWVDDFWNSGLLFEKAISNLSAECRIWTSNCVSRKRGLERAISSMLEWVVTDSKTENIVKVTDSLEGFLKVNDEDIIARIFNMMRNVKSARFLPYLAASRDSAQLYSRLERTLLFKANPENLISFGLHHYIRCTELPISKRRDLSSAPYGRLGNKLSGFISHLIQRQKNICDALGINPPQSMMWPQIPNGLPVLVLTGAIDPVTPFSVVGQAFSKQDNIRYFDYPNLGHVVNTQARCVIEDIKTFSALNEAPEGVNDQQLSQSKSNCSREDIRIKFYNPVSIR
jgi:pimeloyl-ACP methyl ester carboxylesterase